MVFEPKGVPRTKNVFVVTNVVTHRMVREADSGNARDGRGTSARHSAGGRMTTKLASLTLLAEENPKAKFTSVSHFLTEDFLRECFWELKRDKASGIEGVSVQENPLAEPKIYRLTCTLSTY